MTDIVTFPKIFRRIFWGRRFRETAAFLTDLGGEGGWTLRPKRPFEDGMNLYQKPTPKRDKESGHFMG